MSSLDALRKAALKNQERLEVLEKVQNAAREKKREFADKDIVDEEFVGPTAGRMGIVSPGTRQGMRSRVAEMDTVEQFGTEIAPSVGGAIAGGAFGSLFGGVGAPIGAALGGIAGELVGQETGVSPESDAGLILSGAAIGGPVVGGATRKIGRGLSAAISKIPAVASAQGRITQMRAAGEFETIGTVIVGNRKGLLANDADKLYAAAKAFSGASVPIENFSKSLDGVKRLVDVYGEFPGMEAAVAKVEKATKNIMDEGTKALSMDDIMVMYKSVNELANTASRTPGVKVQVSEDVFKMFDDDITRIVESGGASSRASAFTQAAFKRTKLDRAVQSFERGIAQFTKQTPDTADITLDVAKFREWITHKTNPKSASYDKNFTEELAGELPDIKHQLDKWVKVGGNMNPAGPGSIVIRNIGARTGAAIAGGVVAGPVGAGVGAMMGARLPEIATAILMTKKGRAIMDMSLRMGKGTIAQKSWATLAGVAGQAAKPPTLFAEDALKQMFSAEEN